LGCLGSKVNKATMENKKSLQDFLQNIKPKSKLIVYMFSIVALFTLLPKHPKGLLGSLLKATTPT
jgi:hypothetical protein